MSTTTQRMLAALTAAVVAILTGVGIAVIAVDPPAGNTKLLAAALATTGALTAAALTAGILLLLGENSQINLKTQTPPPPSSDQTATDRANLISVCIYLRDRITSRALADRLTAALTAAGVTSVEPTGLPFDPAHHEAGGTTPTTDPALAGTIANIEAPGYHDRDGRTLRPPIVTVYQLSDKTPGAHR